MTTETAHTEKTSLEPDGSMTIAGHFAFEAALALRVYRSDGLGEPDLRNDTIHDLATGLDDSVISLDDTGLNQLERSIVDWSLVFANRSMSGYKASKNEVASIVAACEHAQPYISDSAFAQARLMGNQMRDMAAY